MSNHREYSSPGFLKDLAHFYLANGYVLHFNELFQELTKLIEHTLMSDQGRIKEIVMYILQALYHCVEAPWPKDSMIGFHLEQFKGLLNALTRLREIDNLLDMYLQVKMYGDKEEK